MIDFHIDFQTAQDGPKTAQDVPRRRSKRQDGPKRRPRRLQDGPHAAPKNPSPSPPLGLGRQEPPRPPRDLSKTNSGSICVDFWADFRCIFHSFLVDFWVHFRRILHSFLVDFCFVFQLILVGPVLSSTIHFSCFRMDFPSPFKCKRLSSFLE